MAGKIFVDSAAWLAFTDHGDSDYKRATAAYLSMKQQGSLFVTTNLVVAESYTLIHRRVGYPMAIRFLETIRNVPNVLLVYSSLDIELRAEALLRKYKDQDFSLVDAVSFVVMQEQQITTAFSFDAHFLVAGFSLTPGTHS